MKTLNKLLAVPLIVGTLLCCQQPNTPPMPKPVTTGTINVSFPEGPYANKSILIYANDINTTDDEDDWGKLKYIPPNVTEHSFEVSPAEYTFKASLGPDLWISKEKHELSVFAGKSYDISFTWRSIYTSQSHSLEKSF